MYQFHINSFFCWIVETKATFVEFCIIVHPSSVYPVYYQMHNSGLDIYVHAHILGPKDAW